MREKVRMNMRMVLLSLIAVGVSLVLVFHLAPAATAPPATGGQLPEINLAVPRDAGEKEYLGLSGDGLFKISQIKAEVVIVEIFSMYCPFCQKDAPGINKLYQLVEQNPDLRDRIKLIGIGAGNSAFEVEVYKKTYNVPFPLFPDPDFGIHKACGEVRTPFFVGVKINKDRSHRIFLSQPGGFPGAQPFLEKILKDSGLK
jgi:thiol-disulfide isomerase/thioredoxin